MPASQGETGNIIQTNPRIYRESRESPYITVELFFMERNCTMKWKIFVIRVDWSMRFYYKMSQNFKVYFTLLPLYDLHFLLEKSKRKYIIKTGYMILLYCQRMFEIYI